MLPIYVSYFAAGGTDKRRAFSNSIGFVSGFTIVFVLMGAFAGTIGKLMRDHTVVLNLVTGLIVIVFGLNFLGILKIGFLNRASRKSADVKSLGFFSSMLFGMVFSIGWTPCVGAFLGSALLMASLGGSLLKGISMLLAFSLGLGIPFIASALLIDRLKGTFDFIKRNYRIINIVSGGLLIVVGILMATGSMGYFLSLLTF
ncbi:MAG TPA: cytochrome C biogenesis protein ResB [Ruminococcaceae bacterium]|nr:cytochrome C biogenesis protein ResB [Oscillospiraceae bacterium]